MAGIYIHIPFCKQRCSYCDFHFSTSLNNKNDLLKALLIEIGKKKNFLNTTINTIYIGGGTPSLLTNHDLMVIKEQIYNCYTIAEQIEFTIECNPDDLTKNKLKELQHLGVNRLSLGIQSFYNDDLVFFNRAHDASQAEKSILISQEVGFENISIDLIYGMPTLTHEKWLNNLNKLKQLNIPHLSAYTLTIEPKTQLHYQVENKKVTPLTDEKVIEQVKLLMQATKKMGLNQYEISSFGKEGFYAQHNSNYWKGIAYLGFGPSAHSYVNEKRYWNVSNNSRYIKLINDNSIYFEEETINEKTAYNEYILTRLRTRWGINIDYIKSKFNHQINQHFNKELIPYLNSSYLKQINNCITLTDEGILMADKITSDLFFT